MENIFLVEEKKTEKEKEEKKLEKANILCGGEEKRRGKVGKFLEKEMIFLVAEKKKRKRKEDIIWRTKINGNSNRRQPGEYSAICLFEG